MFTSLLTVKPYVQSIRPRSRMALSLCLPGWLNVQGLSHSTVNCILQDSKGFMWFGTDDGLNRHDGHDFSLYKHNPDDPHSLSHNRIKSLHQDQFGTLWVGTVDRLGDDWH